MAWQSRWMGGGVSALALALVAGCGPSVTVPTGGADPSTTEAPPMTTSTSMPPPDTATGAPATSTGMGTSTSGPEPETGDSTASTDDSSNFIEPRDFISPLECDFWRQDCDPGEKCMPYDTTGMDSWNGRMCVSVVPNPDTVGEPCTVQDHPFSGIDSCDAGSICFGADETTLQGFCYAFCTGSIEGPLCEDPNAQCLATSDPIAALCFVGCDPLAQDCLPGEACYPRGFTFSCIPDASGDGGGPGQPCQALNGCDPGSFCVEDSQVPNCPESACCTSFCIVDDPMSPCLPGQVCAPFYPPGQAPPGFEDVASCTIS
ncbi:MAG: hypothetical protein K0V04_45480 [Deltaproteobacteria bacterium]|nr:hypothetical protein [Deltaproteobacteria bacterium]